MHDHRIGVQIGFMHLCVCMCVTAKGVGAQSFAITTMVGIKVMSSSHIFMHLMYTMFCILVDANLKVSNSSLY
jgi:hypothetical protein